VAAGFLQAFRAGDKVITAYRVRTHALMLGCDPWAVMVELYGRRDGLVRKGGPMRLFAVDRGLWGGYGIVGRHIPLGVAFAHALSHQGTDHVCQFYLGDGSRQTGVLPRPQTSRGCGGRTAPSPWCSSSRTTSTRWGRQCSARRRCLTWRPSSTPTASRTRRSTAWTHEAVVECTECVTARARESGAPSAVEAATYRRAPHGAADFFESYRTKDELIRNSWDGRWRAGARTFVAQRTWFQRRNPGSTRR
jgi:pyruvate dehydrogenase E1 component alpha subunit